MLGAGRQAAIVDSAEEMSYQGIPGFAWRIRVLLADFPGRRALGDGQLTCADARVHAA